MPAKRPAADKPTARRRRRRSNPVATLFGVALLVAVVYLAKPVLLPISMAVLLSFILTPLVTMVQRRGLRRVPSVLIVVGSTLVVAGGISWGVGVEVGKLAQDLPNHTKQIQDKMQALQAHGGTLSNLNRWFQNLSQSPATPPSTPAGAGPTGAGGGLAAKVSADAAALKQTVPPAPDKQSPVVTSSEVQSPVGKMVGYATVVLEPVADAG